MNDAIKARIENGLESCDVPGHCRPGLAEYLLVGCPVGGFLEAVLSNDLMGALGKADDVNLRALHAYGMFLYNHAPLGSYGSPENYKAWIESGGILCHMKGVDIGS